MQLSKYKCPCLDYKQSGLKTNELQNIMFDIIQIHCDQEIKPDEVIHGISTKGTDARINFF